MKTEDQKTEYQKTLEETHVLWNGAWFKKKAGETDEEARQRLSEGLRNMPREDS